MSGHWRFCVAASLFCAGLATSPAFSNPLTDLFNPAPKEAPPPAPAPVREACVPRPGNSAARGQHWFYHVDGHRKCWFQAAEATASVKRPIHHYAARRPVVVPEEDEVASHKKTPLDARAQLLSAAQPNALQPPAPAPEVTDDAPAPDSGAATIVPAAPPIAAQPAIDQLMADRAKPRPVDVEMLLAASSLATDMAASSVPPANPAAPSIPDADENHWELMATRAGMMLIALGFVFLLGSLLVSRFLDRRMVSRAW